MSDGMGRGELSRQGGEGEKAHPTSLPRDPLTPEVGSLGLALLGVATPQVCAGMILGDAMHLGASAPWTLRYVFHSLLDAPGPVLHAAAGCHPSSSHPLPPEQYKGVLARSAAVGKFSLLPHY